MSFWDIFKKNKDKEPEEYYLMYPHKEKNIIEHIECLASNAPGQFDIQTYYEKTKSKFPISKAIYKTILANDKYAPHYLPKNVLAIDNIKWYLKHQSSGMKYLRLPVNNPHYFEYALYSVRHFPEAFCHIALPNKNMMAHYHKLEAWNELLAVISDKIDTSMQLVYVHDTLSTIETAQDLQVDYLEDFQVGSVASIDLFATYFERIDEAIQKKFLNPVLAALMDSKGLKDDAIIALRDTFKECHRLGLNIDRIEQEFSKFNRDLEKKSKIGTYDAW